jgi:hypothetical protein
VLDFFRLVGDTSAMIQDEAWLTVERWREADRSQGSILAAARQEFAEFGFCCARWAVALGA